MKKLKQKSIMTSFYIMMATMSLLTVVIILQHDTDDIIKTVPEVKTVLDPRKVHLDLLKLPDKLKAIKDRKYILYWHRPWGDRLNFELGEECGKCIVTDDRAFENDPLTGALIFHFIETRMDNMPAIRNPNHYYVYQHMESPSYILNSAKKDLAEFDNIFNWTMTFRRDSTIYKSYGNPSDILRGFKNQFKDTDDTGISYTMSQKTKLAVWIVSNCAITKGAENRMKLVSDLVEAGLDVDRRGKCFPDNPPPPSTRRDMFAPDHRKFLLSSKFYLSFENAHHCKDYITEKLFNTALASGTVPIVWGAKKEEYLHVLPPHSAVFVDDFNGDYAKLVDYINYLDLNDTAYMEYFKWRLLEPSDLFGYHLPNRECQLCQKLNGIYLDNIYSPVNKYGDFKRGIYEKPVEPEIVTSLKDWVFGSESAECLV